MHLLKIKSHEQMLNKHGDEPQPDKNPRIPVSATKNTRRMSRGSYQAANPLEEVLMMLMLIKTSLLRL